MDGLMYILSTGGQWRRSRRTRRRRAHSHDYFDLWTYDGTLEDIHHALYVMQLELEELEHAGIEKAEQLF